MRRRFAGLLLAIMAGAFVLLGGCTTNASGDTEIDPQKAGDVAGQIVEGVGNFLNEIKDKAGEAWSWLKSNEQTVVVAKKYHDGYNYHFVSKDGVDYQLQLRTYGTKSTEDPDKDAYDAIVKGQRLTVWAIGSDETKTVVRIVG